MCKFINLRASKIHYLGDIGTDKRGFTYFYSVAYEFRAMFLNFQSKFIRYRDSSVHAVDFSHYYVELFAPSSDGNDTAAYHDFISNEVNLCFAALLCKKNLLDAFLDLYIKHAQMECGLILNRKTIYDELSKSSIIDELFAFAK